jgi:diadenosine tetraphosphatase ApaH/serine/threonine PP2A family protein phosphatase
MLKMTMLSADEFEDMIISVARIIRQEHEQGRLNSEAVVDNKLIRLPAHGRAIFVGDIHGELDSLNELLRQSKFAEEKVKSDHRGYLIFLGDLVDRGPNSIEVLTTLFELKIQLKGNVIFLKGNHELPDVNSRYGFIDEVHAKYRGKGKEIYALSNRLFEKFPHAVMTGNGIFAVHGGIPENVSTLRQIADLEGTRLGQLLWNDPRPDIHGFEQNYGRDPVGLSEIRYFGDDVAKRFLRKIGATVLVRGHEYYEGDGYAVVSRRVLTIFTAKYGRPDWKRAYIDTDLSKRIDNTNSLIPDIRTF